MIAPRQQTRSHSQRLKLKPKNPSSLLLRQSGFTIVESLMAIVVVGILMTVVAPVIALSVATRVQARRVELATQAARNYIDGVKSGAIAPPTITAANQYLLDSVAVPTALTDLYCVDLDGTPGCSSSSSKDLAIQAFRTVTSTTGEAASDPKKGYRLGIRVYRADAFSDSTPLVKGTKQATFTGGMGNRKVPLVEMTTEISTEQTRFRDFCERLGGCQ